MRGEGFVHYIERANVFVFSEYLGHTPAVLGIIHEIEALAQGINYTNTTDAFALAKLLQAASQFWH